MIDFRSDQNRKQLTEWEMLVPSAGARRDEFLQEVSRALADEGIGEVEHVRGDVNPLIVRVRRPTHVKSMLEADTTATAMGRQLHVSWGLYWRPPGHFTIDRAWMDQGERAEARPFASVAVSIVYTVAGEYFEEGSELPPLEPSGIVGVI